MVPRNSPSAGPRMRLFERWQRDRVWRPNLFVLSVFSASIARHDSLKLSFVYFVFPVTQIAFLVPSLNFCCLIVISWICLKSGVRLTSNPSCASVHGLSFLLLPQGKSE